MAGWVLVRRLGLRETLFLASDEASFIHGAPMLVDGGWTLA